MVSQIPRPREPHHPLDHDARRRPRPIATMRQSRATTTGCARRAWGSFSPLAVARAAALMFAFSLAARCLLALAAAVSRSRFHARWRGARGEVSRSCCLFLACWFFWFRWAVHRHPCLLDVTPLAVFGRAAFGRRDYYGAFCIDALTRVLDVMLAPFAIAALPLCVGCVAPVGACRRQYLDQCGNLFGAPGHYNLLEVSGHHAMQALLHALLLSLTALRPKTSQRYALRRLRVTPLRGFA